MENWVDLFVFLCIDMETQSISNWKNGDDDAFVFKCSLDLNEAGVVLEGSFFNAAARVT